MVGVPAIPFSNFPPPLVTRAEEYCFARVSRSATAREAALREHAQTATRAS